MNKGWELGKSGSANPFRKNYKNNLLKAHYSQTCENTKKTHKSRKDYIDFYLQRKHYLYVAWFSRNYGTQKTVGSIIKILTVKPVTPHFYIQQNYPFRIKVKERYF